MKKKYTIFLFFLFLVSISATCQNWIQKSSLYNYGRRSTIGCSLNGKGYTGLGITSDYQYLTDFWEYDTSFNTWTQKSNYPGQGIFECTVFCLQGKIFVGLGVDSMGICHNDLWAFDPNDNHWTPKNHFPGIPRYGAKSFVIGDSAYIVGGSFGYGYSYLDDMFMYDAQNDTWIAKSSFSGGSRAFGTAFSINGVGYYGAGLSNTDTPEKSFWKYLPQMDIWEQIPDLPLSPRNAPISFTIDDLGYIGLGGNQFTTAFYNDFGVYNPESNIWDIILVPDWIPVRSGCIGFSIGNSGYFGLGINSVGVLTDFWQFLPKENPNYPTSINSEPQIQYNSQTNLLSISSPNLIGGTIKLVNLEGQIILQKVVNTESFLLDLTGLTRGMYIVFYFDSTQKITKKFIKYF